MSNRRYPHSVTGLQPISRCGGKSHKQRRGKIWPLRTVWIDFSYAVRNKNSRLRLPILLCYDWDYRASKAALFDGIDNIEEGGIRASSSYSREIDDHTNDKALDSLEDRVSFLKRLTGDIHGEVENHNRMLDRMGTKMDATRGIMSGTMDRFKIVLEKKSSRKMFKLAAYFVVSFFVIYYFIRVFRVFMYG